MSEQESVALTEPIETTQPTEGEPSEPQAIEKAMDLMVGNMLKSMYHRLEVQMFYGQSGLGEVEADSGAIGGEVTHEFHVLADSGEDKIIYCKSL